MQRVLVVSVILVLGCTACATVEKAPMDARLVEAQRAFDEGKRLRHEGQYAQAVQQLEHALELRESVLGQMHPEVARCLNLLGNVHQLQGNHARAEMLLQRALGIAKAALGENHPEVGTLLNMLADLYTEQGLYSRAEPLFQRALAIQETALGKNHPDVAITISNLANFHFEQAQYAQAESLLERALKIQEAALGKDHLDVAITLNLLAVIYNKQGHYARAESLHVRALGVREAALGKNHLKVAQSLLNLASTYRHQGHYTRAESLYERSLAIQEAALGKSHPDCGIALNSLAAVYRAQGQYARAEPLYERAIVIFETSRGRNHPHVADPLHNLSGLYMDQGQYVRAEPLIERALAIWEASLGKNHPKVASALNVLALLYRYQGQYERAEPLYERVLAILEGAYGQNHPLIADALNNLANFYEIQGQYERAESLHLRALAIREKLLGENHAHVAIGLDKLADLYLSQRQYGRAEPLYLRALAIRDATFGENYPLSSWSLTCLADIYAAQGQYTRAEPLYLRALALVEEGFGKNHPSVSKLLQQLALLRASREQLTQSLPLFERALSVSEAHLRQEVLGYSEARLTSVLSLLRAGEERLYALVRAHPNNGRIRHLALTAALLRKGRSVDEVSVTSLSIYSSLSQDDREVFERLRGLRTQRAMLSIYGPGPLPLVEYRKRLEELADQGDALEEELARRSAPVRALRALPSPAEILDRVAATLPRDGVLVEFVAYDDRPLVPGADAYGPRPPGEPRYLALLLFPDGNTRTVDLGPATPIDRATQRLHDALADRAASYPATAQALHTLVFRPLMPFLGKSRRLFLATDGQLALVPFDALHDGKRFLFEGWDITYLTSGKDLLRRTEDSPTADSVVVLANPDFGVAPSEHALATEAAPSLMERSASLERFFSLLRSSDVPDHPWPALLGTQREAEAIQRLLPQARLLLGRDATKDALLKLPTPGVLHIATHGFFLEDASASKDTRGVKYFGVIGGTGPLMSPPDPLLRSGLVLAGARVLEAQPGMGARHHKNALVTALELAGLNLWGTQLVVLSACDTGRGDVKRGQGVYGLRRALVVAGAETVVTSLWKVNDGTTSELMESYYRYLLAGEGRVTALREAMRELRKKRPHPYYWAPFIAMGQDAPLRGLAPDTTARSGP